MRKNRSSRPASGQSLYSQTMTERFSVHQHDIRTPVRIAGRPSLSELAEKFFQAVSF